MHSQPSDSAVRESGNEGDGARLLTKGVLPIAPTNPFTTFAIVCLLVRRIAVAFIRRERKNTERKCNSPLSFRRQRSFSRDGWLILEGARSVWDTPAWSATSRLVFAAKMFGNKEMRILMLGLDAAGKTSAPPAPPLLVTPLTVLPQRSSTN